MCPNVNRVRLYAFLLRRMCRLLTCTDSWFLCIAKTLSRQIVTEWRRKFFERREEIHEQPRAGIPQNVLTSDAIAGVRALLDEDRQLTVRQIECLMKQLMCTDVSLSTIHSIIRDELNLSKVVVSARWVPRQLTVEHKTASSAAALNFLTRYHNEGESTLDRIVPGDKT